MSRKTPQNTPSPLTLRIKQQLDTQAQQLDQDSTAKLDAARRKALAAQPHNNHTAPWWKTLYAPALAMSLVVAFVVTLTYQHPEPLDDDTLTALALPADIDVVMNNEDLELMEEDLEFYLWLDDQATAG